MGVQAKAGKGEDSSAVVNLTITVSDKAQMSKLMRGLKQQRDVYEVYRTKN